MTRAGHARSRCTTTCTTCIRTRMPLSRLPSDEYDGLHGPDHQRHPLHPPQPPLCTRQPSQLKGCAAGRIREGVLTGSFHPLSLPYHMPEQGQTPGQVGPALRVLPQHPLASALRRPSAPKSERENRAATDRDLSKRGPMPMRPASLKVTKRYIRDTHTTMGPAPIRCRIFW